MHQRGLPAKRKVRAAALLRPRQVAIRAQETAFSVLAALDRGGLVPEFLRRYAIENQRPGRIANPLRYRELVETVRREALLVLALQIDDEMPQRLGVRIAQKITPAQKELVNLFRDEFFVTLGRSLNWGDEEFQAFCNDLELYLSLRAAVARSSRHREASTPPAGPFADRCGFLIDAPMLDQGRRAAARFEAELIATASRVLKKIFSQRGF
ncbi:MAG TPA: hypothetical protein VGR81_09660 [Candidatus Acidoferrales bacterium]|nr:hypothetical protein [Candidatus Acidoferrales bacterium]